MANKIAQFYKTKGVNTRENRLTMDPLTWREGTQNAIIDQSGDLTQRYGYGHRDAGGYVSLGEIDYRFADPDSGEQKSEILQVRTNGKLYRRLLTSGLTINQSHSLYFDGTTFSLVVGATTFTFTESKTLAQISTDLTAASIAHSVSGTTSTPVYLLGTFVNESGSHYAFEWEEVPFPDSVLVPFPEAVNFTTEGVSYVNLNNVCYITVGGFPMKYDGKMVYRAGVPKILTSLGNLIQTASSTGLDSSFITVPAGTGLPNGAYYYVPQYGYRDAKGAVYWGAIDEAFDINGRKLVRTVSVADRAVTLNVASYQNGKDFGAASCVVNGTISIPLTGGTLTVNSGHNVKAGMCLMQPCYTVTAGGNRDTSNFFGYYAAKVANVTATTIVLQTAIPNTASVGQYTGNFVTGEYIGAGFVTPDLENKWLLDVNNFTGSGYSAQEPFGAFVRYWRSKVGAPDTLYKVIDLPVPYQSGTGPSYILYSYPDNLQDTSLVINKADSLLGSELPRACRYLCTWQNFLTQAGRPVDVSLAEDKYPSWTGIISTTIQGVSNNLLLDKYTEAHLCDAQSVYWADANNEEGFPQGGLNENRYQNDFNDRVKGIKENKDVLFVFKQRSTAVSRGDLGTNDVVTEFLETDAGLLDHRSIADVDGALIWCDPDKGFWSCVAGRLPVLIGDPIQDQFLNNEISKTYAVAANWQARDIYICYMQDKAFAYDYGAGRGFWYEFTAGFSSVLYTGDEEFLLSDGTRMWQAKDTLTKWDCSDYKSAINMKVNTAWINFKQPTIDKKFNYVWINSIQGDFTLVVEQYGNYLSNLLGSISLSFLPEANKKFVKKEIKTNMEKLSALSLGFTHNTAAERVKIQGWELQYSQDYTEPKD